ncbi:MAG: hypothetical protein P8183_13440, partial [Anaerolineae bacterium]
MMRLFEILLLACCLLPLVGALFFKNRLRWLTWLPLTAVILLPLHLILEGYRWQMVPAYVLVIGLLGWTLTRRKLPAAAAIGG